MSFWDRLFRREKEIPPLSPQHGLYLLEAGGMSPVRSDSPIAGVTRASFAQNLAQSLFGGATGYSDAMLARAYIASVTAWACINLKAGLLSALPVHVVERENGEPLETEGDLMHPLGALTEDSSRLLSKISTSLDIFGRAYMIKRANQHGFLSSIEFISPLYVSYRTNQDRRGINRIVGYQVGSELLPPHMMIDIKLHDPVDPTNTVAPLETVMTQISIGRNIGTHAANFFFNGATLSGIVTFPDGVSEEQLEEAKRQWAAQFRGASRAHKTFFSGAQANYQSTQANPKDLDMSALSNNNAAEVCRAFNVDPVLVGLGKASDPLSAQGTFEAIERAQIRGKTVPRAEWILGEINRQWAWRDFRPTSHFTLAVNRTEIAALSNATLENATISTTLQAAGTITLDESRARMELPPLDNGNGEVVAISGVLYPAAQLAEVARLNVENLGCGGFPTLPFNPIGDAPSATTEPPAAESAPQNIAATEALNGAQITAAIGVLEGVRNKTTTPLVAKELLIALGISPERAVRMVDDTIKNAALPADLSDQRRRAQLTELRNWRKLAYRDEPFKPVALEGHPAVSFIRKALDADTYPFDIAKRWLETGRAAPDDEIAGATPEQFEAYWKRFDELKADVGKDWLDWMARIWDKHKKALLDKPDALDALAIDELLASAWVGTPEEPGPLTELFAAGVAAGNDAINQNRPADPNEPRATAEISFDLTNEQAVEYAQSYMYELIKDLNGTTARKMQRIVAAWIESGEPLSELEKLLSPVFHDAERAKMIAQTESTRVFNEGAFTRYEEVGVTEAVWQTARDTMVCDICRRLHGQVGSFRDGWVHPGGRGDAAQYKGNRYRPPAHPRCRCFSRPHFSLSDLLEA